MTRRSSPRHLAALARRYRRQTGGAAAAELAIWVTALIIPIISVYDLGYLAFQTMQVNASAQAAAAAAWHYCSTSTTLPAVKNCTNLTANMTTAAQQTSLGANVTISAPIEGYYCATASSLVLAAGSTSSTTSPTQPSPDNCVATLGSGNTSAPGDYIQVTASYNYTPIFLGASLLNSLGVATTISRTAWMRLQ